MRKGISKNRPKGTEFGRIKSHEKLKKKLEEKKWLKKSLTTW